MALIFEWLAKTHFQVDGGSLTRENLLGLNLDAVKRWKLPLGNRQAEVGELFKVEESDSSLTDLRFRGDLRSVRGLGRRMTSGTLRIEGVAGSEVGAEMLGGRIEVEGSVGDWAGAEMRGGLLSITGDSGKGLGASREGSRLGMRDGLILVKGSTGADAGRRMRRGVIAVEGNAGNGLGGRLIAGSVFVLGEVGRGVGLGMKRGTIALLNPKATELLPGFVSAGRFRFPFLTVYLKQLCEWGVAIPPELFATPFQRYNGDITEGGKGEILSLA